MDSLPRGTGSGGNVFGAEFLIESRLEGGDFSRRVLVHAALGFFEWIAGRGTGRVWHRGG